MRTLRARYLAATMAAAFAIGVTARATAQDTAAEARKAAEAKAAAEAKRAAESDAAADEKRAAERKAAAEAKAASVPPPTAGVMSQARRGVRPGDVQKVFTLKHVRVDDMARVLSVFPSEISGMERGNMRVLSVSAAAPVLAAIEETIKRLDVPSPPVKSVEITAYILECSPPGDAGTVPADLQDVVGQLKRTFGYSGCGLARTLFSRGADGSRIQMDSREGAAGIYALTAMVIVDASDPSAAVRLSGLNFQNTGPTQNGRLNGDIAIRDGQKVVLGRLGATESGRHQIVVLAAKLVP